MKNNQLPGRGFQDPIDKQTSGFIDYAKGLGHDQQKTPQC